MGNKAQYTGMRDTWENHGLLKLYGGAHLVEDEMTILETRPLPS